MTNTSSFMPEKDLMYTILADMKRTVREYVTAATEANCPQVRQMFTDLTNSTLRMQGDLYKIMQQHNMYTVSSSALQQDVNKELQSNQQMENKCRQFVQQKLGKTGYAGHAHGGQEHSYHQSQSYDLN